MDMCQVFKILNRKDRVEPMFTMAASGPRATRAAATSGYQVQDLM